MKLSNLLFALLLFAALGANAQSRYLPDAAAARKTSEGIVASVAAGNTSSAIKELRGLSVVATTDFDVFEAQLNNQQANLLRQFGEAEGYEFAKEERVGSRLLRLQYLVFHKNAPIRWMFVFYKTKEGWVVSHFSFDGNAMQYLPGLL